MRKLRLGIVGLGTWARTGHLPVYWGARLRETVDVVALCSRSAERARLWAGEWGVPMAFADFDDMLARAGLDAVSVTTPDDLHTPFVLQALSAGCHVLVEKPLATQLDECQAITQAARSSGRQVFTLFHKRADPLWAEAARRIGTGSYGAFQSGWATMQNPLTVPLGDYFASPMAARTNPNWFLGTHFYDLIRFMTGLDPVSVRAHLYTIPVPGRPGETLPAWQVGITFAGGATVAFLCSWNLPETSPALTKQEMRLHFDRGELELDGTRRGFTEDGPGGYRHVNPYFLRETAAGPVGYGATFLEEAILSLSHPTAPRAVDLPSLADAWWATAVAAAAGESAARGREILVRPPPAGNDGGVRG